MNSLTALAAAALAVVTAALIAGQLIRRRITTGLSRTPGRPERRLRHAAFAGLVFLTVVEGALTLLAPWPIKIVIDNAIGGKVLPSLLSPLSGLGSSGVTLVASAAGVALVTAIAAVGYAITGLGTALYEDIGLEMRAGLFRRLLTVPLRFHDHRPAGDLVNRLTADVAQAQEASLSKAEVLIPDVFSVLGMGLLMLLLSPLLAVAVLVTLPALGWIVRVTGRRIEQAHGEARELAGQLAGQADEVLGHLHATHAFGQQEAELQRYEAVGGQAATASIRASLVSARLTPAASLATAVSLAMVLVLGASQVTRHMLSLGGLFVFLAYLAALDAPIQRLSGLAATFGSARASRRRLAEILETRPMSTGRLAHHLAGAPAVAVRDLTFGYHDTAVLQDLTFTVRAGEVVCLTGPSGAGKSTLLSLLARLQEPTAGAISIDGTELAELSPESLRRNIALVPQDSWLIPGSVADNIAYGRDDATRPQVAAAAELALVTEFTDRLPGGLDTPVGTHGALLSGGQRRRVALARALLTGARLLLLDEPTSGLDAGSAEDVVRAIRRSAAGRTVIMVSHDPALIAAADRQLALDQPTRQMAVPALAAA